MSYTGGRVPYGFLAIDGELAFNPDGTGPMLAQIMRWNRMGFSTRRIAETLNSPDGIEAPSGGKWSYGIVARVIAQGKKYSHLIPFEYAF